MRGVAGGELQTCPAAKSAQGGGGCLSARSQRMLVPAPCLTLCPAAPPLQLRLPEAPLVTDGGLAALAGLTALQELDLSCWQVRAGAGPPTARPTPGESQLPWVEHSPLAHTVPLCCTPPLHSDQAQADAPVGDAGAAFLAPLGGCMASLSLAGRVALTAGGLAFLGSWGRLQRLDLSKVQLDRGSADFLWQLTRLTCLLLGGTKVRAGAGREEGGWG